MIAPFRNPHSLTFQIKESFQLVSKSVKTNNEIFSELQTTTDLYKVERVDVKKKLSTMGSMMEGRSTKNEIQLIESRLEQLLLEEVGSERIVRNQQTKEFVEKISFLETTITAL